MGLVNERVIMRLDTYRYSIYGTSAIQQTAQTALNKRRVMKSNIKR